MVLATVAEIVPPKAFKLSAMGPMLSVATVPRTRLPESRSTLPVSALAAERVSVPEPPMLRPTEPAATEPVIALLMVKAPVEPPVLAV